MTNKVNVSSKLIKSVPRASFGVLLRSPQGHSFGVICSPSVTVLIPVNKQLQTKRGERDLLIESEYTALMRPVLVQAIINSVAWVARGRQQTG